MPHSFPIDIWSIKTLGIREWLEIPVFWPIGDVEYRSLLQSVHQCYFELIASQTRFDQDLLWAANKLCNQFTEFLYAILLLQRLEQQGSNAQYTTRSALFRGIENENVPIKPLPLKTFAQPTSFLTRTRADMSAAYNTLKLNRWQPRAFRPNTLLSLGAPTAQQIAYARDADRPIQLTLPAQWVPTQPLTLTAAAKKSVANTSEQMVISLYQVAERFGIAFLPKYADFVRQLSSETLTAFAAQINYLRSRLRKKRPMTVMMNWIGTPTTRALCVALRQSGGQAIGFPHGHNFGQEQAVALVINEMSLVDTFVAPTVGSQALFERQQALAPSTMRPTHVVASRYAHWGTVYARTQRQSVQPREIKRLMILEYPLVQQRHYGVYGYWAYQLKLTIRVATIVRENGLHTILKRHPGRLAESEGIYDAFFDELIASRFESEHDEADAYLFTSAISTTFAMALLTHRPIITFSSLLDQLWDDARQALEKRCRIVPSWFDEQGELQFDPSDLMAAIKEPTQKPDMTFVESYMIPTAAQ